MRCLGVGSTHQVEDIALLARGSNDLVQTINVPSHEHNENTKDPGENLGRGSSSREAVEGGIQSRNDSVDELTGRVVLVVSSLDLLLTLGGLFVQLVAHLRDSGVVVVVSIVVVIIVVTAVVQARNALCSRSRKHM